MMDKNILVDFSRKVIISTTLLILISSVTIYYIKKDNLYNNLGVKIKKHLDLCSSDKRKCFDNNSIISSNFIKHIKMVKFSSFNIYDKNYTSLYTYTDPNIKVNILDKLKEHFKFKKLKVPTQNSIVYDSFEVEDDSYYLYVVYPVVIHKKFIGYIVGYKNIDKNVISDVESDIYHVITTIIFSIFIFSLAIFPIIYNAYKKLKNSKKKLLLSNIETINTLGNAIALRDSDTNEHNYRVTIYAVEFAKYLKLNKNQIKKLIIGSFLHDVGKIGISDIILLKNERLTDGEFEIMKGHISKGVELIKNKEWLENARDVILYHHERYDGGGYPNGVSGKNIPLIARAFCIVDVFDALTSVRPYKKAFSYEKSIEMLKQESSTHFDEALLLSFIKISKELYLSVSSMSSQELKDELDSIIKEYFDK